MTGWQTAFAVELRKAAHARVVLATSLILVGGVLTLAVSLSLAARSGDEELLAKLGPVARQGGWDGYLATAAQVTAAGGLLALGTVLSWLFGREFTEGTVSGLFGLPVSRSATALAKVLVHLLWTAAVGVALVASLAVAGLLLPLGAPDHAAAAALGRELGLVVLTGLLVAPCAWVATASRGVLAGIAVSVVMLASAQVLVVAGAGAWFPVAAPALWSVDPGAVPPPALALVLVVALAWHTVALVAWERLQLDR